MHFSIFKSNKFSVISINRLMLIVVAFTLPFPGKIPTFFILLAGILWLSELITTSISQRSFSYIKNRFISSGKPVVLLAFFLLILLYIAGFFYSENIASGKFELEKKSLMLLFPLYAFTSDPRIYDKKILRDILLAYLTGLLIISIYDIVLAVIDYTHIKSKSVFYYSRLSRNQHPSYLALYSVFAIAASFRLAISEVIFPKWLRIALMLNTIWLLLFVILLSSKAGILSLFIVVFMSVSFLIIRVPIKTWLRYFVIIFLSGLILASMFSGNIRTRLSSLSNINLSGSELNSSDNADGVVVRILCMEVAWEQFLESPLFGTGTGDYHKKTNTKLTDKNLIEVFGGFRNAHNQYLQTAVTIGIAGFVALLMYLIFPLIALHRELPWLFLLFVIIVAFNLIFESMLEKQAGVFFIIFFHTMLYRVSYEQSMKKNVTP